MTKAADGLDRYACRWGELADEEWVAEGSANLEKAAMLRKAQ